MELKTILEKYRPRFEEKYGQQLLPGHYRAINAILRCRTQDSGEMHYHCTPCDQEAILYHFCGHRSCP